MQKCDGNIQINYLIENECEIIGKRHSPRMIETKRRNDKFFTPHMMAVEKRRKRINAGTRKSTIHESAEIIENVSGLCKNLDEKEEEIEVSENIGVDLNNENVKELLENDIKAAFNKHVKGKHEK